MSETQRKFIISILKDENKAVLRQYGTKLYEFSIDPNESYLSIEAKTDIKMIDKMDILFVNCCKGHLISFLTNLRIRITQFQPHYDNLHQDENFKKALECFDKELKLKE